MALISMHFSLTDKKFVSLCFFFGGCFLCLCILVLSAIGFGSCCFKVHHRGNSTSTQPQVESFENTIEPKTLFCIEPDLLPIIYWSKLPLAFRPSCKVCVSDTFQASIFFDGRKDSLPHPSLIVAVLFGNPEILFGCQFCRIQHKVNICML